MESTYEKYLGKKIINYTIDDFVGRGRYGMVFSAHGSHGQTVAVKVIELPTSDLIKEFENAYGGSTDELENFVSDIANKFVAETESMMRLSANDECTNIIKYIDHSAKKIDINWQIYIVMEFATPFKQYLAEKPITVGEAIDLGIDIASGLKICHEYKIIHRDIKEDNIFYGSNGHFKIGDFGVANMNTATRGITQGVGSEYYMAPEVKKGERYTGSVDIYSLGIVLYKLFNYNRYPFMPRSSQGRVTLEDNNRAFNIRMSGEKVPPPEFAPEALAPVIQKACEYDKDERYPVADSLIHDLTEAKKRLPDSVLNSEIQFPAVRKIKQISVESERHAVTNESYRPLHSEFEWNAPGPVNNVPSDDDGSNKTISIWDNQSETESESILRRQVGPHTYDDQDYDLFDQKMAGESTVGILKTLGTNSAAGRKLRQKIEQLENEKVLVMEKQKKIKKRNIWIAIAAAGAALLAIAIVLIWPQTIEYRAEKADEYAIHKYQFGIDRGRIQKNDEEVIGAYYLDSNDKKWLYFSQKEDELVPTGTIQPSPLYKIKRDGTQLTMISDKHCEYDVYYDGWIYFISYYEDRALCRVNPDGKYDEGTNGVILWGQPVSSLKMNEKGIIELTFDDGTVQKYDVRNAKDDYTKIIEVTE